MGRKPLIQTRVERDTKDAIDSYTDSLDDQDISQSEAIRHLIRAGLAEKGHPVAAADGGQPGPLERLAAPRTVAVGAGLIALSILPMLGAGQAASVGAGTAAVGLLGLSTVLMVLALVTIWTAALAQLALARPLRALVLPGEVKA